MAAPSAYHAFCLVRFTCYSLLPPISLWHMIAKHLVVCRGCCMQGVLSRAVHTSSFWSSPGWKVDKEQTFAELVRCALYPLSIAEMLAGSGARRRLTSSDAAMNSALSITPSLMLCIWLNNPPPSPPPPPPDSLQLLVNCWFGFPEGFLPID